MPHGCKTVKVEWAKCPRCGKCAEGMNEIERKFGYRTMENGDVIPQSHCRSCRSEEAAERR